MAHILVAFGVCYPHPSGLDRPRSDYHMCCTHGTLHTSSFVQKHRNTETGFVSIDPSPQSIHHYFYTPPRYPTRCLCGDTRDADIAKYGEATCTLPCTGDHSASCGGCKHEDTPYRALHVYIQQYGIYTPVLTRPRGGGARWSQKGFVSRV